MGYAPFPKTVKEFHRRFQDDPACVEQVLRIRWPAGMVCPKCKGRQFWQRTGCVRYQCQKCLFEVSPTAKTFLHRARVHLRDWFTAAFWLTESSEGRSAYQLQRKLGCSSKTAWHMLHKLRCAMATEDRGPLGGTVEMGDNWSEPDVQANRYPLFFGAVAVLNRAPRGERSGRLYLVHVQEPYPFERSWRSLIKHVDYGARLKCWPPLGCDLERPIHREYTPHIDRAFKELRTWLAGYQLAAYPRVPSVYLPRYLSEFVFKFNRGQTHIESVETLLELACNAPPKTV